MKSLDSRRRNFAAVKKIEDIRLPSWLMVKENDFSLIGEMTRLKQLSCLQEIKEEKTEKPKAAEQPCGKETLSEGSTASEEPLHLGDTAHLSIDGMGIVLFSPEVMRYVVPGSDFLTEEFTNPKQVGEHIRIAGITSSFLPKTAYRIFAGTICAAHTVHSC